VEAGLKPRLRGVSHQYAFFVSVLAGVVVVAAASGARERGATAIFAVAGATMFGGSALYHRIDWQPHARRWMRRLDHAAIYLLIAGTYTPFALLALEGAWRWTILGIVWTGAAAAIALKLAWTDAPKWVAAVIAVGLGWIGAVVLPQLWDRAGAAGVGVLAVGGVMYTAGAGVYARGRPDPVPAGFCYHELFHALVIAATACQYAAGAVFVLG